MTIHYIGQNLATSGPMDGRFKYISRNFSGVSLDIQDVSREFTDVSERILQNFAEMQETAKNNSQTFHSAATKLQFSVNKELGKVIIKVVDKNADKVLKEIPSADMQQVQLALRRNLGLLVDIEA